MSVYYFDEDHEIAYKIDPVMASVVHCGRNRDPEAILVHTDVKVTNIKKEKVRRTLSEVYPTTRYDLDSAKKVFSETLLSRLIASAKRISEEEYASIKNKFEA